MKRPLLIVLLGGLVVALDAVASVGAMAETKDPADTSWTARPLAGGTAYLGMPYSFFEHASAVREGISSGGLGFAIGVSAFVYRYFVVGLEYGGDLPGDNRQFTNVTTAGKLSSSIYINQVSFCAGLKTPRFRLGQRRQGSLFGSLTGGMMLAFGEKRHIDNCVDCDEQGLSIAGGPFVEPEVMIGYAVFALGVGYRHLFGSDYRNRLQLKLGLVFGP